MCSLIAPGKFLHHRTAFIAVIALEIVLSFVNVEIMPNSLLHSQYLAQVNIIEEK